MSSGGAVWRQVFDAWLNKTGKSMSPAKQKAMMKKIKAVQGDYRKGRK